MNKKVKKRPLPVISSNMKLTKKIMRCQVEKRKVKYNKTMEKYNSSIFS